MNPVDNINTFAKELEASLEKEIEQIRGETSDEVILYSRALHSVKSKLSELRRFTHHYKFKNQADEIEFFKVVKPSILSQYYYYDRLISFSINQPNNDLDKLKNYCEREMSEILSFSNEHLDFFKYCTSSAAYHDEIYFVRRDGQLEDPNLDAFFSTGYDVILSRFISGFLLIEFIKGKLKASLSTSTASRLTWTSKKTHLVELIYALRTVEAFNNGKAELKEIAATFEDLFNTKLDNIYKKFQEITLRKTNKTAFLDELKEKLEQRLDEGL